jgi:peptidoglycan/xylan/chitin deacetylase (PgdA/CDA1 family)
MSRFHWWLVSFTIILLLLFIFPSQKLYFATILVLHIPVFVFGIVNIRYNFFLKSYYFNKKKQTLCALTFDDGPDEKLTPAILDILDRYDFKATFFVIATKVEKHPQIVQEIIKRGHTIGCHDLTHSINSNFRMTSAMIKEIGAAQSIIEKYTGKKTALYRPPVGLSNPHLVKALKYLHMKCVGWKESVRDAGNRRINTFDKFYTLAKPGSVILMHDCMPDITCMDLFLREFVKLCETMKRKGFVSVTVDELLEVDAYL